MEEVTQLLTTPTLTWLDIEKCDKIMRVIAAVESEQPEGVLGIFEIQAWQRYRLEHLTEAERSDRFAYFDFDNHFTNMFRSGSFYARLDFNKFSLRKLNDQFVNAAESLAIFHRGNEVDRSTGLIKNEVLPAVSYRDHVASLLAQTGPIEELPEPTFFYGQPFDNKIAYASYSRSGNTFFRKYLEQIGGIYTGSDGDLNYALHYSLQFCGFSGECKVNDECWFLKTHYPLGKEVAFVANKVILCVRNPLDVVTSMFNFWSSQTQNLSIEQQDFHESLAEAWANLIKQEITCWRDFHTMWINKAKEENFPVLFFRFEDISRDPKPVLMDVFAFSLGVDTVDGTLIESKIDLLFKKKAEGKIQTQLYKPREASANNKNLHRFTNAQLQWIVAELGPLIDFFGYNNGDTNFFPAVEVSETPKFTSVNSNARTVAARSASTTMQINDGYNVRGKKNSRAEDIPEGFQDRGLPNFNFLIDIVSVKDAYTPKL